MIKNILRACTIAAVISLLAACSDDSDAVADVIEEEEEIVTEPEEEAVASGYTFSFTESTVYDSSGNEYSALTKYVIVVYDTEGNPYAEFDMVNSKGLSIEDLPGKYTATSYPRKTWMMDNGWVYSYWGTTYSGGSYFTDDNGVKQFITGGSVTISVTESGLYSFTGSDLTLLTADDVKITGGTLALRYTTYDAPVASNLTCLSDLSFSSSAMGRNIPYTVLLPESYDGTKKYPVLYLLHGASGSNNDWVDSGGIDVALTKAVANGAAPEMIVVMPCCTISGRDYFYCDTYVSGGLYKTFFFEEFMPYVEKEYNVISDGGHRAVAGLSMGGYGSLYWGGLYPDDFCYIYACSPATSIDNCPDLYEIYASDIAAGYEMPGITMEIGTSDFLYSYAYSFYTTMTSSSYGLKINWIERDGSHTWDFWTVCGPKILKAVGAAFDE